MGAKIKLDFSSKLIEVEGQDLNEIFEASDRIQGFISSMLSSFYVASLSTEKEGILSNQISEDDDLDNIDDAYVRIEGLAEQDWMLIIAYYISGKGKNGFSKADLIDTYKQRHGDKSSNLKNLSRNYLVFAKKYLRAMGEGQFRLSKIGLDKSKTILTI
jgi:hypothetical protein